jgi:hypothetical protein
LQVYELADELGIRTIDVLDEAQQAGVVVRDAGSTLDDAQADRIRGVHQQRVAQAAAAQAAPAVPSFEAAMAPSPGMMAAEPSYANAPPPPPTGFAPMPGAPVGPAGPVPPAGAAVAANYALDQWGRPMPTHRAPAPMHPLIKTAIWQLVLAQFIPCVGLYFFIASYINAGKGRRQIAMWNGKWGGDTAGLAIQIVFWLETVFFVVVLLFIFTHPGQGGVTPTTLGP